MKLRARYKLLVELRQQSGFGWDDERYMVTATDSVWSAFLAVRLILLFRMNHSDILVQKHSKFIWFRSHSFPLFDDLASLCENTFATGEFAFAVGGVSSSSS